LFGLNSFYFKLAQKMENRSVSSVKTSCLCSQSPHSAKKSVYSDTEYVEIGSIWLKAPSEMFSSNISRPFNYMSLTAYNAGAQIQDAQIKPKHVPKIRFKI
jgi:hypothetical protein